MKAIRDYGVGIGLLLLVAAFILNTFGLEARTYVLALAGAGLLLLLAGLGADRKRVVALLTGRRGRAAGASIGYSLVVLAVVVLINFLAGRHHTRLDLTEGRLFSLSEQTIRVLEGLPREVTVTAFFQDGEPTRQKLQDLFDEYRYRTDRLQVRFVDPDKNPAEARRYDVKEYGTIVLESGERESRVSVAEEEAITNALIQVTRDTERIVYFSTGHGERGLDDAERSGVTLLKEALEKQHYVVRPLLLNQPVPDDATVIVIAGPDKRFLDAEIGLLRAYLEAGGRLLLMQDPGDDPGLGDLLAAYGVAFREDVVIDKISQLFGGDALVPLVAPEGYDGAHAITRHFDYQTFYPMARSIEIAAQLPDGIRVTRLARTSDYSWGELSQDELQGGTIQMTEGVDVAGPVTLGAAVESGGPGDEAEDDPGLHGEAVEQEDQDDEVASSPPASRLLLFGDSDFPSNAYFNVSGNGDFVLSGIAWLAEQGDLVSIRAKTATPRIVVLTSQQAFFYFWTIVAFAPLAITVAGVGIWMRRKKL